MRKSATLAALALLLCLLWTLQTLGQEPAKPVAPTPVLAGRLDVNSLIRITEKAGKYADRVEPGSSGKIVLAVCGLTINPQVIDYDLSKPFSILLFFDQASPQPWSFCAVLAKKREKVPPLAKIFGTELHVRDLGDSAALASAASLLSLLPQDLQTGKIREGEGLPDLSLTLSPEPLLKDVPLSELLTTQSAGISKAASQEDLERLKASKIKLARVETVARQLAELRISLSFGEERAVLAANFKPKTGSPLESFLAMGKDSKPSQESFMLEGSECFGSASIAPDPALVASLSSMYNEIAVETSLDEKSMRYADAIAALAKAATGDLSYCSGMKDGFPVSALSAGFQPGEFKSVEKALAANAKGRTEAPGLWLLRDWSSGASLYCLLEKDKAKLVCGKIDEDAAASLLAKGRMVKTASVPEEAIAYLTQAPKTESFSLDEPAGARPLLTLSRKGNGLELKLEVSPEDLGSVQPALNAAAGGKRKAAAPEEP